MGEARGADAEGMRVRVVGVDTGGTFTDFIFRHGHGGFTVFKRLSTPHDPAEAVLDGLARAGGEALKVVHGSTVATNAILERKGVRTALVTNAGFADVIEIGRQNRSRLYDLHYRREPHIVPRELRFGVPGRVGADGAEVEPLDEAAAREAARGVAASGAESCAVCFLFSYLDPSHEDRMRELLAAEGVAASVSHEILAEFREFERTSTTVVNAYVSPIMARYLGRLRESVEGEGGGALRIMQSNGGSISAATAMRESVRTILSGPAGGAVGAMELGRAAGHECCVGFDMGGTSTDVSLMDRGLPLTVESEISGYPVKVPMIDIHTVGAGGGSVAALDAGGALTVGPESAGADPGPVCYGKGERITVTDANLFLGRLVPERFLGGGMRLDAARADAAMRAMAAEVGLGPMELAEGIVRVANAGMERAIRVISVERGHDPHDFTLLSFGGAGGLHCAELARALGMPRVLCPANAGVLSALGMLLADVVKDYSHTVMLPAPEAGPERLDALFAPLEARANEELAAEGFDGAAVVLERTLDMRYAGQSFELMVPLDVGDPATAFHALHEQRYGYARPEGAVEVVNLRLRARGVPDKPEFPEARELVREVPEAARLGTREVVFDGKPHEVAVLDREELSPGNELPSPCLLTEYSTTTLVPPFARARVDARGNIVMEIES